MEAVLTAASMAKRYGLMTVLKPSSCGPLPEELLKNIDVAVPNAEELSMILSLIHISTSLAVKMLRS